MGGIISKSKAKTKIDKSSNLLPSSSALTHHDATDSCTVDDNQANTCSNYISFLNSSWPGSILDWSPEDLKSFSECFTPVHVHDGQEVRVLRKSFRSSFHVDLNK